MKVSGEECPLLAPNRFSNLLTTAKGSTVVVVLLLTSMLIVALKGPAWANDFGDAVLSPLTGREAPLIDASSNPWLSNLHISGFYQNQTGMWVDSEAITYNKGSRNSLSAERNFGQTDLNYNVGETNSLFVRGWWVYEPAYPWEFPNRPKRGLTDFYNQYGVHDAWYRYKKGPFSLYLGRQIVTWGESISFRVADVINPQDTSFAFGFANLEQSRMPVWMAHPIVNLPDFGPFLSNDIEGVYTPPLQPEYTNVNYPDKRYRGQNNVAGGVNTIAQAGMRFAQRPYPCVIQAACPGTPSSAISFPQVIKGLHGTQWVLPPDTWSSSNEGVRLHTLVGNIEATALYYHGHQNGPVFSITGPKTAQQLRVFFPEINDIGVTANTPIYFPESMPSYLTRIPFVLRTELLWQDRTPFNINEKSYSNAVTYSSTINTLVALDIASGYAPWLTKTGTLNANIEWQNYSILSYNKNMEYATYAKRWRHNEENLLLNVGTSWWWGAFAPNFSGIYNPDGNTFLLFPNITLTPTWTNKYFVNLKYIGILGNDKYALYSGGTLKGKSMFVMTWQYNFSFM